MVSMSARQCAGRRTVLADVAEQEAPAAPGLSAASSPRCRRCRPGRRTAPCARRPGADQRMGERPVGLALGRMVMPVRPGLLGEEALGPIGLRAPNARPAGGQHALQGGRERLVGARARRRRGCRRRPAGRPWSAAWWRPAASPGSSSRSARRRRTGVAFSSGSRRTSRTCGRSGQRRRCRGRGRSAPNCSVKASSWSWSSGWSGNHSTPWRDEGGLRRVEHGRRAAAAPDQRP